KRLLAEGHPYEEIAKRLAEKGLSPDDVKILIGDHAQPGAAPGGAAASSGGGIDAGLVVGLAMIGFGLLLFIATGGRVVAYGVVLVGLVRTISSLGGSRKDGGGVFSPPPAE